MAVNWDMLFANNSGQDLVNNVGQLMKEFKDRDLAKQVQNSNNKQRTWEKQQDIALQEQSNQSSLASAMYGAEARQQESQLNRENNLQVADITAMGKVQDQALAQQRYEQEQAAKAREQEQRQFDADRKYQLEVEQARLNEQKESRAAEIAKQNMAINQQNANTQLMNAERAIAKEPAVTAPGFGGFSNTNITPIKRSLDGTGRYTPPNTNWNLGGL